MTQYLRTNNNLSEIKNATNQLTNQKSENKKVLCSLKQQMNSIRQEMSKLIKIKSEQKLKMLENKPNIAIDAPNKNTLSKNNSVSENILQQKIKRLQKENLHLQNKLKQIQNVMGSQIDILKNKQKQQTQLNQIMVTKIKNLEEQVEILRQTCKKLSKHKNKKINLAEAQQQLPTVKTPSLESHLNPQIKQEAININQKVIVKVYDITKQQRQKLVRTIHHLQSTIARLELRNAHSCELIQHLNENMMKGEGRYLQYKYRMHKKDKQQCQND